MITSLLSRIILPVFSSMMLSAERHMFRVEIKAAIPPALIQCLLEGELAWPSFADAIEHERVEMHDPSGKRAAVPVPSLLCPPLCPRASERASREPIRPRALVGTRALRRGVPARVRIVR
jgi:hypothetical protein